MINDKEDEAMEELSQFFLDIKLCWKYQWKVVDLSLIALICCNANVIE